MKEIRSLTILLCCLLVSSIATNSFAHSQRATQSIGQYQRQVAGSINYQNRIPSRTLCHGVSCGYQNFRRPNYFQSLRAPYQSSYRSHYNACPHYSGYSTGYGYAFILAAKLSQQVFQPSYYTNNPVYTYVKPGCKKDHHTTTCEDGSYRAYVGGKWVCHKPLTCENNEYKAYEDGKFVCKEYSICTQEIRFCSNGTKMPREEDCTWRPDKCDATGSHYSRRRVRRSYPSIVRPTINYSVNQNQNEMASQNTNQLHT